jgi:hypothetical protein
VLRPYGVVCVLLLLAIGVSGVLLRQHSTNPSARQAQAPAELAQVERALLAQPWPGDPQEVANLAAALAMTPGPYDASLLVGVNNGLQIHRLLDDPPPAAATVGALLAAYQQGRAGEPPGFAPPEREGLWDRLLAVTLTATPGTADATWGAWLPRSARAHDYHFDPAGAWVANQRTGGYQAIVFPLTVRNRGPIGLDAMTVTASFLDPQQQAAGIQRPHAKFTCPLALPALASGTEAVVACSFVYPSFAKDAVAHGLQWLAAARTGQLQPYLAADTAPGDPAWKLPPPDRAAVDRHFATFRHLQDQDRQREKAAGELEGGLLALMAGLGLALLGCLVAGALTAGDRRPGPFATLGGFSVPLAAIVVFAVYFGEGGLGPLAILFVGGYGFGAFLAGYVLGYALAPLRWPQRG